jgi:hypothetical protein
MNPIRLRGPGDVLATLPYQLGYHPQDAVVVVALRGRAIGLVQRLDLPPEEHVAAAVRAMLAPLLREQPDAVLVVGYESRERAASPVLDALEEACDRVGLAVADRLVVRGGRWFAPHCRSGCCPPEGTAVPEAAETPAVADFVAMEIAPVADRASLADQLEPDERVCREVALAVRRAGAPPGPRGRPRATHAGGPRAARSGVPQGPLAAVPRSGDCGLPRRVPDAETAARRRWLARWAVACDVSPARPPLERLAAVEVAELVVSLRDVALRDGLIAWLCPGSLPMDALGPDLAALLETSLPRQAWAAPSPTAESVVAGRRLQARLIQLCRMVPDPEAAPVLTVLANLTWWLGDGALTRAALARALRADPDYRLARLLDRMVDLAIRPGRSA